MRQQMNLYAEGKPSLHFLHTPSPVPFSSRRPASQYRVHPQHAQGISFLDPAGTSVTLDPTFVIQSR